MSDLVEFLAARYAEEENAAREILDRRGAAFIVTMFAKNSEIPDKFARRVLAEVAAKRRIIALAEQAADAANKVGDDYIMAEDYMMEALSFLALPYDDHKDYREEWRV